MLPPGFFVVHDTSTRGEHDVSKLTRGKKLYDPLLEITELDVVAWADAASLVDAEAALVVSALLALWSSRMLNIPAVELDHDLAVAVIVNFLEFTDVAWISS
jgi:hypothetical protein